MSTIESSEEQSNLTWVFGQDLLEQTGGLNESMHTFVSLVPISKSFDNHKLTLCDLLRVPNQSGDCFILTKIQVWVYLSISIMQQCHMVKSFKVGPHMRVRCVILDPLRLAFEIAQESLMA